MADNAAPFHPSPRLSADDAPLKALLLPFDDGALAWPPEGQVVFLRARDGWPLRQYPLAGLRCEQGFKPLADGLRAAGLEVQGEVVTGVSVDEIVRVAQRVRADLIVVGHKHLESWAERWWRGSVSKSLIEISSCSVLVVITP